MKPEKKLYIKQRNALDKVAKRLMREKAEEEAAKLTPEDVKVVTALTDATPPLPLYWLAPRMSKNSQGGRSGRSGRKPEHIAALAEDPSQTLAIQVAKAAKAIRDAQPTPEAA